MELILQDDLEHQLQPIMNVAHVVETSNIILRSANHRNPKIYGALNSESIAEAWKSDNIPTKMWHYVSNPNNYLTKTKDMPLYQMMDVKMETGTGKTYVYVRTIYELHKRCGFNKFIVAVPTLPIKAGARAFMDDPYVQRHFSDVCGYHSQIELCLLESQKQKKKGRLNFPTAVGRFFYGNHYEQNKIYVLLINPQLITNGKLLTREDYDQMVGEFHRPIDAIKDTCPVLIIDEPHRMMRDSISYTTLIKSFCPQLVLRYGATFPEHTVRKGKSKQLEKDYVNLVYDLDACDAFEQTLIKGVAKEHLEVPGGKPADKKIKITNVDSKKSVSLQYITTTGISHFELHPGDSLSQIDSNLDGVSINGIKSKSVVLSNGQEKMAGEEFFPDQYSASYQEGMIALALKRHFETERENFERKPTRIKTLALFFIDNIESYRGAEKNNDGWLHNKFIELLRKRVEEELQKKNSTAYNEYLQATLSNLEGACAAYFSQDNQDSDEAIAREVWEILHGKKELISFIDSVGKPNVRRFLFSKWTLKEGWDNPNIFTICKLRSSGSEISKLQEVGRGLRLPVDEAGNRIVDKEFMLNYIVDFTEKDFATKLVAEINRDIVRDDIESLEITSDDIVRVAAARKVELNTFFIELLTKGYIDINKKIQIDKFDELLKDYPEFNSKGVDISRIKNRNSERNNTVGIRKAQFVKLKELWSKLNRKYVLYFEKEIEQALADALPTIIKDEKVFALQVVGTERSILVINKHQAESGEVASTQLTMYGKHYAYNVFLKQAARYTSIPINILHQAICQIVNEGDPITNEMFNENSLTRLINAVDDWKTKKLQGMIKYKQANYFQKETKLTNSDGSVKDEVAQAYIGRKREGDNILLSKRYLYDGLVYDSDLERENIMKSDIDEIIVYGKIPSSSICIPTIASSNYSPDFMYVVKKKDGSKELNIVIETKAYDGKTKISEDEISKINCAKEFFNEMRASGYDIHFRPQINSMAVKTIIESLIN